MAEHFVHGHAGAEGIANVPDSLGTRHVQLPGQGFAAVFGVQIFQLFIEAFGTHFQATQCLLHRLLEGPTNGHNLTHRLHLGGQAGVGLGEFFEGKPGNLGNHVINGRLERGRGDAAGDFVLQFIKGVTHGQLGRHLGDREASGLGRQR